MQLFNFSWAEFKNREHWHWQILKTESVRSLSTEAYEEKVWIGPEGSKPGDTSTVWSLIPYHYQDINPISVSTGLLAIANACCLMENFPSKGDYLSDCQKICPGLPVSDFADHWLECRDMSARFNASAPAEIREFIYGEVARNMA